MTYQDLLEELKNIPEEYLDQDVEIAGECIVEEYYDVEFKYNKEDGIIELLLV
tara:strand:- start:1030 stop:1188 length:159 start_codon:yes stop_codon:yes gene_type:complete